MPYNPGTTYHAGDYFAAAGPRINENIQTFLTNRRQRQEMTTTAEMLGRYLAKDPQAMEMFGDDMAKIPDMSLGKAKGTLGAMTTYMAQRHLKELEDANREQNRIAQDRLYQQTLNDNQNLDLGWEKLGLDRDTQTARTKYEGDKLALDRDTEAAKAKVASDKLTIDQGEFGLKQDKSKAEEEERQNLAQFNRYMQEATKPVSPPVQVPYAQGPDVVPEVDAQTVMRYAGLAKVLGHPQVSKMITDMARYGNRGIDAEPVEFSKGAWSGIFSKKTGQFKAEHAAPDGGDEKAVRIVDENGKVLGHRTPSGAFMPLRKDTEIRKITPGEQANIVKARAKIREDISKARIVLAAASPEERDSVKATIAAYEQDLRDLDALMPEKPAKEEKPTSNKPKQGMGDLRQSLRGRDLPRSGMGDVRQAARAEDTPEAPVERIKMVHPDGRLVGVRADQVEEAIRQGFKRAN